MTSAASFPSEDPIQENDQSPHVEQRHKQHEQLLLRFFSQVVDNDRRGKPLKEDDFDCLALMAFIKLRDKIKHVKLHDITEEAVDSGRSLPPGWIEKTDDLVSFVQLELRYEIFKAMCKKDFAKKVAESNGLLVLDEEAF